MQRSLFDVVRHGHTLTSFMIVRYCLISGLLFTIFIVFLYNETGYCI